MTTQTHYEILGVEKDATEEHIKKAYRRKIRKAHADGNDNPEGDAAAINVAYETLMDPERRAHYDKTGENSIPNQMMQAAHQTVVTLAMQWISNIGATGNMVDWIVEQLNGQMAASLTRNSQGLVIQAHIQKQMGKIKYKGSGVNMVENMLNAQLEGVRKQIEAGVQERERIGMSLQIARDYDYDSGVAVYRNFTHYQLGRYPWS